MRCPVPIDAATRSGHRVLLDHRVLSDVQIACSRFEIVLKSTGDNFIILMRRCLSIARFLSLSHQV
jgi:hypothetical protein